MSKALEAARAAVERHAWSEAFELLSAQDASEPLPPDGLELLGYVAWWTSNIEACIDARERAYAAYMERGDTRRAGMVCLGLAEDHFHRLAESVGSGWLSRAERLLGGQPETIEYGWLVRTQAVIAYEGQGDIERGLELAQVAFEIGDRFDDTDLQALSLHDQGRIMLAGGRVEEGLALMEEVMAQAVSGELEPMVTGRIYCNMIDACERLADYRRANEWDEEARRWCDRVGHVSGFPGVCRVKRAEIMRRRGMWTEAEREARRASEELSYFLDFAGHAFSEIGEIRLRVGDLSGAREVFRKARELGHDPEPGLALLRLAEDDTDAAHQLITETLDNTQLPLDRARLLPAKIEISLRSGKTEEAQAAASELKDIAEEFSSDTLAAAASHGLGAVALHGGSLDQAVDMLHRAWKLWSDSGLPYEAARARLSLGLAHRRRGAHELARLEIEAALAGFMSLGAEPDAQHATTLLQSESGQPTAVRTRKTLMFTDIVSSTPLIETIGDEAWTHLVQWHDRTLRSCFEQHDGKENDRAGDGFFVVFPTPRAAIDCAIDIQRSLHRHRTDHGFAPEVRIGVHGAEVTEVAGQHTGVEVNKAARMAAMAEPGEIVASAGTAASLPDGQTSNRRSVSLEGLSHPVEIVTVIWR